MSRIYTASDGDRLDIIVFKAYEDLTPMPLVLEANPHLLEREELSAGDIVSLPDWSPPKAKEESQKLW